jgi:hypothetical protein
MTPRNPRIDPRVSRVRPAGAEAYLLRRGWVLSDTTANFQEFEHPKGEDGPLVRVPLREQGRDYAQRITELITDVALVENRYAVEVLDEMLGGVAVNGAASPSASDDRVAR